MPCPQLPGSKQSGPGPLAARVLGGGRGQLTLKHPVSLPCGPQGMGGLLANLDLPPRAAAPALPHTSHAASSPFFPKRPQACTALRCPQVWGDTLRPRGIPGPLLLESNSAYLVRLGTKSSSSSGERVVATTPVPGPFSHLLRPDSRSFLPPASTSQEGSLASPSIPEGRCPNPGRV